MAKLNFSCLLLTLAILMSLTLLSPAIAQQSSTSKVLASPSQLKLAIPPEPGLPTLESQTKKITPLATPSITINPQPTAQTPVSEPFWTSLSRCSIAGGLSCTSAAIAVVITIALILTGLWLKKLKQHKNLT